MVTRLVTTRLNSLPLLALLMAILTLALIVFQTPVVLASKASKAPTKPGFPKAAMVVPPKPISIAPVATTPVIHYTDRVTVLMYHHIGDDGGDSSITTDNFRLQMEYLKSNGYNVISMSSFMAYMEGLVDLPPKAAVITFDDGYKSVYDNAFPILKEFNFPATCYIVAAHVGMIAPGGTLMHMTWDEMLEMKASGLIEYGSHTYDQHLYVDVNEAGGQKPALVGRIFDKLTMLQETREEYESRIYKDLALSKSLLEQQLGTVVNTLAYPYGAFNSTVKEIAWRVGFRFMLTVKKGIVGRHSSHTELRRINAGSNLVTIHTLAQLIESALVDETNRPPKPASITHQT